MSSPPPYPPTKTHSHPSRPVQVSPPPGSLLRSCHGTLQLPQHLTQHLQELSYYLASSWFFPCLSPAPLPASPCSKKGPAILSTLCWVLWLLFSLPVLSFLGFRPLLRLDPASALSFSLDIVANSLSPLKAQLQIQLQAHSPLNSHPHTG